MSSQVKLLPLVFLVGGRHGGSRWYTGLATTDQMSNDVNGLGVSARAGFHRHYSVRSVAVVIAVSMNGSTK